MKINKRITLNRVTSAVARAMTTADNPGFCTACGADADGCEPDARKCRCEICGACAVYGAEELAMVMM